jgi:hypothetical protein
MYKEFEKIVAFDQPLYLHVVCISIENIRLSTRISLCLITPVYLGSSIGKISYHLCFDLNDIYMS